MMLGSVKPSRLVLGAKANNYHESEHVRIIESAIEKNVWLHTSLYYQGSLELIGHLEKDLRKNLKCIAKVSVNSRGRGSLRSQVEATLAKSKLEKLDIVQICGNPSVQEMSPGRFFRSEMDKLISEGKVEAYYPELYWQYSDNFAEVIEEGLFDGCIFYHNVFLREVQNDLYEKLREKGKAINIVALRALGGGPGQYYEKKVPVFYREQILKVIEDSGLSEREFRLAYLLSKDFVSSLVVGTSKESNFNSAFSTIASGIRLDEVLVKRVDEIQASLWSRNGIGNGEGLHRAYGRLGIKLFLQNSKKEFLRLVSGQPKGFDW